MAVSNRVRAALTTTVLATAATGFMAGCGVGGEDEEEQVAYCTDENGEIVDEDYCDDGYRGGAGLLPVSGRFPPGLPVGSRLPPVAPGSTPRHRRRGSPPGCPPPARCPGAPGQRRHRQRGRRPSGNRRGQVTVETDRERHRPARLGGRDRVPGPVTTTPRYPAVRCAATGARDRSTTSRWPRSSGSRARSPRCSRCATPRATTSSSNEPLRPDAHPADRPAADPPHLGNRAAQRLRPVRPPLRRRMPAEAARVQRRHPHRTRGVRRHPVELALFTGQGTDQWNALHDKLVAAWQRNLVKWERRTGSRRGSTWRRPPRRPPARTA